MVSTSGHRMLSAAEVAEHLLFREDLEAAEVVAQQLDALLMPAPMPMRSQVAVAACLDAAYAADRPSQSLQMRTILVVFSTLQHCMGSVLSHIS